MLKCENGEKIENMMLWIDFQIKEEFLIQRFEYLLPRQNDETETARDHL